MPITTEQRPEERFLAAFELSEGLTLNGSKTRLRELRKEALDRFASLGFPTPKVEAWKYTNIRPALAHDYRVRVGGMRPALSREALEPHLVPDLESHLVVLVNGTFSSELSDVGPVPSGVVIQSLTDAARDHPELVDQYLNRYTGYEEDPFAALNTAFVRDGVFVHVPDRVALERPVQIVSVIDSDEDLFVQPRNLFVIGEGAEVRIVHLDAAETDTRTFNNSVSELYVGERANVDMYRVQREGDNATAVAVTNAYQEGESVLSITSVTLSGALVRNNINLLPDAEHCESHLIGLYMPRGTEHVDNHTLVDHAQPDCFSNELYKGVLEDRATGVFNGKVLVRRDAQRINAFQENKTIVLSDDARMNAKPELEIYADDVKCSHGATTGQLDEEALFYLRSRGLSEKRARAVLLQAFARDILEKIEIQALRAMLDDQIEARFTG